MPTLCKVPIHYMNGCCGPSTLRELRFNDDVILDEEFTITRVVRVRPYPVEIPVSFSDKATSVWNTYLSAFHKLEAAKAEFEKAKQQFKEAEDGKEIQLLLVPESGPLPFEAIVSEEDMANLKALVETTGVSVVHTLCEVEGYSIANIQFTLSSSIPIETAKKLTYKSYKFPVNGCYTYNATKQTINKALFTKTDGKQYPPYKYDDWKEVRQI